jgi:hypothetical protein
MSYDIVYDICSRPGFLCGRPGSFWLAKCYIVYDVVYNFVYNVVYDVVYDIIYDIVCYVTFDVDGCSDMSPRRQACPQQA